MTDKEKGHELLEECEEQAMADAFASETDMFKNTALYFILYVLVMVALFSLLNACLFGADKLWEAM